MHSSNTWAFFVFRFGLAPDTISLSSFQSARVRRRCCSWSSTEVAHVTGSPCPMVVPPLSTWSWLVTFMILTGTLGRPRTKVLAVYSPSREVFRLRRTRTFAAPRGACSHAVTSVPHRAGIALLLPRESRNYVGCSPGFHSVTSSWGPVVVSQLTRHRPARHPAPA
jgi:hypothetical protein